MLTFDLETTVRSPVSMKASPFWTDNKIVVAGFKEDDRAILSYGPLVNTDGTDNYVERMCFYSDFRALWKRNDIIVGQNVKFDLLHLLKTGWVTVSELVKKKVWDTQLAEYIISGQRMCYASLNELADLYHLPKKNDKIKEFWDNGVDTECIPYSMLVEYLENDVYVTHEVAKKQMETLKGNKLVPSQMRALLATTIMEHNGMCVDLEYVQERSKELAKQLEEGEALLSSLLPPLPDSWQWTSPKDVSLLLFGGTHTTKEKQLVGKYKNGNDKYKLVEVDTQYDGLKLDPKACGAQLNKMGYFVVDETVLKNASHTATECILNLRTWGKQRETYYENLRSLTFMDGRVHPNLNHTSTKTGRLSCNKPNIQNQTTEGGIKRAYKSRWEDGYIVDFDYSQLEMAGLAAVANDEQLSEDINNGIDMHTELYKSMYGRPCTKDERKVFKRLTFGLVYGAGPATLAANASCSLKDAKKFIKVFYDRYKGVAKFHSDICKDAKDLCKVTTDHSAKGFPHHIYTKEMPTGRKYVFRDYDSDYHVGTSFSPTELKNWPVQGFATGDIVPHMVGLIVEKLCQSDMSDDAVPIMTVHDSIVFDVRAKVLDRFVKACYTLLSNTTGFVNHYFSIDVPVKLSVGCSVGRNWQDMTEIDFSKEK